jgi:hypothetical protein
MQSSRSVDLSTRRRPINDHDELWAGAIDQSRDRNDSIASVAGANIKDDTFCVFDSKMFLSVTATSFIVSISANLTTWLLCCYIASVEPVLVSHSAFPTASLSEARKPPA